MSDARVAILIPVLRRPHRLRSLVENIRRVTPEPHELLFLPAPDDAPTLVELERLGAAWSVAPPAPKFGVLTYSSKVNHGYRVTSTEFIFHAADDVVFHPKWLWRALKLLDARPNVGVLATNDLSNPRVMSGLDGTHNFVRRSYVEKWGGASGDRRGEVLSEAYRHNRCDTELVGIAQRRRAFAFARTSVVEHFHPNHGKAERDEVYRMSDTFKAADKLMFAQRYARWRRW